MSQHPDQWPEEDIFRYIAKRTSPDWHFIITERDGGIGFSVYAGFNHDGLCYGITINGPTKAEAMLRALQHCVWHDTTNGYMTIERKK